MSEELVREAVDWMRAQSAETQSELYWVRSASRSLSRRDGAREVVETDESTGAGVRVLRDGRMGFASGAAADLEALKALWRRASAQIPELESDSARTLAGPMKGAADAALTASLWDDTLFSRSWEELDARLAEAESAVGGGKVRALRSTLGESRAETFIAGTSGLFASERGGFADLSVSVAAQDGGETQIGESHRGSRRFDALDARAAGAEASRRALAGLGARRPRAARRPVLFEPWVGAEFLEFLADLLSAEEVQGHRSLLEGKLGRAVASSLVTLRDEPRRPAGPASALFDDEGLPTRDKTLIERGVLREFFHDAFTSARAGVEPNACGYRDGWSGLPGPGASNLILLPGAGSRESLIADTQDGLLVMEVLGLHTADPVSGEFSVGVSGYQIEKGAPASPFGGAMLSGNVLELLGRVDAVASDLAFHGSFAAPTFRVSALDVA